ncbi:MAG: tyrosine-type recombinase/integrase [Bacteroidetes bacterium]|jgi:hypothetical protein|nr:tyrosine-type recombinase/integrase [Bacteroidota bacterium]
MAIKEYELLPYFARYIRDTEKGRRTKTNGEKITPQTIRLYRITYGLLALFAEQGNIPLRFYDYNRLNKRERLAELKYWRRFETLFIKWLFTARGVHDNYAGAVIKQIKSFFKYLNEQCLLDTGPYYKSFKVLKCDVPVTALNQEILIKLIHDKTFHESLKPNIQRTKDIFVFGCTVALRFSDIRSLRPLNIEQTNGDWYIKTISRKTKTHTAIKLPDYIVEIVKRHYHHRSRYLFPLISLANFNKHLKTLGEAMQLTWPVCKTKTRYGKNRGENHTVRFCDTMSSHLMRRTAITNMLVLGMSEQAAKYVSGHSGGSKSFYRYVAFSQAYINKELDAVYSKMQIR